MSCQRPPGQHWREESELWASLLSPCPCVCVRRERASGAVQRPWRRRRRSAQASTEQPSELFPLAHGGREREGERELAAGPGGGGAAAGELLRDAPGL